MKEPMNPQIALRNLQSIAAAYKGTLEEHQALQESLLVFQGLISAEQTAAQKRASSVAKKMMAVPKPPKGDNG